MQPVRTALFAPGIKERVMTKALESGADAVILDLEDSVPLAAKAEARTLVAKAIDARRGDGVPPGDLRARERARAPACCRTISRRVTRPGLDAVLLSKAETIEDVQQCAAALERHEAQRGMKPGSVEIILQIENALGVYNCFNLIKASPRVAATCFGSARDGDLQSDLGCSWSIEGTELLYARSKVLLDTRAAGGDVFPLDGVFADLNDEAGLIADSRLSARLGYIGRTVIHPKQIAPVQSRLCRAGGGGRLLQEDFSRIRRCGKGRRRRDRGRRQAGRLRHGAARAPRARARQSRRAAVTQWISPLRRIRRCCARMLSELLDDVCPPDYAERCDNEARPPREAYQALAKHGWFGLPSRAEYGGTAARPSISRSFWKKPAGILKNWRCGCSAR